MLTNTQITSVQSWNKFLSLLIKIFPIFSILVNHEAQIHEESVVDTFNCRTCWSTYWHKSCLNSKGSWKKSPR